MWGRRKTKKERMRRQEGESKKTKTVRSVVRKRILGSFGPGSVHISSLPVAFWVRKEKSLSRESKHYLAAKLV